jgi:hypothetical protein
LHFEARLARVASEFGKGQSSVGFSIEKLGGSQCGEVAGQRVAIPARKSLLRPHPDSETVFEQIQ